MNATLSVRRPKASQYQPIEWKKRKGKYQETKREPAARPIKGIDPAVETRESHTIEYGVTKIIPQRYWLENESPIVLRGSAARRRISVAMCDHSAAFNHRRHIWAQVAAYKHLPRIKQSIIEYIARNSLSCSLYWAKMLPKSSWNQMSLPIKLGHQTPSGQFANS